MEDGKVNQIISRCIEVFKECEETLQWVHNFISEHPHISEIPEELDGKMTSSKLELFDIKIMLENIQSSLGKEPDNV
tara:strand:- start:298 stop:528 length:231 start_codon:yes stop_codon:yes gene_type:complete